MKNIYELPVASDGSTIDSTSYQETIFLMDGTAAISISQSRACPDDLVGASNAGDITTIIAIDRLLELISSQDDIENLDSLLPIARSKIDIGICEIGKSKEIETLRSIEIGRILNSYKKAVQEKGENWFSYRKEKFEIETLSRRICQRFERLGRIKSLEKWAYLGSTVLDVLAGIAESEPYRSSEDPIRLIRDFHQFEKNKFDDIVDAASAWQFRRAVDFVDSFRQNVDDRERACAGEMLAMANDELLRKIAVESGFGTVNESGKSNPGRDDTTVNGSARAFLQGFKSGSDDGNKNRFLERYRSQLCTGSGTSQKTERLRKPVSAVILFGDFASALENGSGLDCYFNLVAESGQLEDLSKKLVSIKESYELS